MRANLCSMLLVATCSIAQINAEDDEASIASPRSSNENVREYQADVDFRALVTPSAESAPTAETVKVGAAEILQNRLAPSSGETLTIDSEDAKASEVSGTWALTYPLSCNNVPLSQGSHIVSTITQGGDKALVRERNLPKSFTFSWSGGEMPLPLVSLEEASSIALEQVSKELKDSQSSDNVEGYSPRDAQIEIWTNPETSAGHQSWAITLAPISKEEEGVRQVYRVYVEAGVESKRKDGKVLEIQELVRRSHYGNVRGPVWRDSPRHDPQYLELPGVTLIVNTENGYSRVVECDGSGRFDIGEPALVGQDGVSLTGRLKNRYFHISNSRGPELVVRQSACSGQTELQLGFVAHTEYELAQLSAFYWAQKARDFASEFIDLNGLTGLQITVNSQGTCNGFYYERQIKVCAGTDRLSTGLQQCINKANRDTITHEYGHAVLDYIQLGRPVSSYDEGFADALTILMTRSPDYGAYASLGVPFLRSAKEVVKWTDKEIQRKVRKHSDGWRVGQVYSGFVWELVEQLKTTQENEDLAFAIAKELVLKATIYQPLDIPSAIEAMLYADDDEYGDGNIRNGTEHATEIARAAASRELPIPNILWEDIPSTGNGVGRTSADPQN